MAISDELAPRSFGRARVHVFSSKQQLAKAAASEGASVIRAAIAKAGRARIMVATGNSQLDLILALTHLEAIDWKNVEVFHMDEYVGIASAHTSSFRYWIRMQVEEAAHPYRVHYLGGDAADLDAEVRRYTELLNGGPIHLAFVGFGENGHIAFNDPAVADFQDPAVIKRVTLDEECRRQQVGEGHFPDKNSVPGEALTVTCPCLFRAEKWICCVPDARKDKAVRDALEGPISIACPASIVRTHPNASVYLDAASAALVSSLAEACAATGP